MYLDELSEGTRARIVAIDEFGVELAAKLREIGFCEGDDVQLLTRGPLAGEPLAIRLNRRIIAMRSLEAHAIQVDLDR